MMDHIKRCADEMLGTCPRPRNSDPAPDLRPPSIEPVRTRVRPGAPPASRSPRPGLRLRLFLSHAAGVHPCRAGAVRRFQTILISCCVCLPRLPMHVTLLHADQFAAITSVIVHLRNALCRQLVLPLSSPRAPRRTTWKQSIPLDTSSCRPTPECQGDAVLCTYGGDFVPIRKTHARQ
jgi:hypothetical protein